MISGYNAEQIYASASFDPWQTGTEYQIDHYAYDGGEELFWSETRGDVVPMGSTNDNDSRANTLVKTIKNAHRVESSSGKKFLKFPKFDNYNYIFTNSFHGYESGVLLYKKSIEGHVENGLVIDMSVWNKTEYYTYLNGMKVGVFIEDEGGFMIEFRGLFTAKATKENGIT